MLIDLSHEFYDGMPGFKYKNDDGTVTAFDVSIKPFLTHEQTRPRDQGKAEFEITEFHFHAMISMQTTNFLNQPILPQEVIEAYKKDIDRTLLRENLKLTPEERLLKLMQLQRFADELREAGRKARRDET